MIAPRDLRTVQRKDLIGIDGDENGADGGLRGKQRRERERAKKRAVGSFSGISKKKRNKKKKLDIPSESQSSIVKVDLPIGLQESGIHSIMYLSDNSCLVVFLAVNCFCINSH